MTRDYESSLRRVCKNGNLTWKILREGHHAKKSNMKVAPNRLLKIKTRLRAMCHIPIMFMKIKDL